MGLLLEASSGQNELSYEQAKDVPYLQATINEGCVEKYHCSGYM
jgi:hypothetical protein